MIPSIRRPPPSQTAPSPVSLQLYGSQSLAPAPAPPLLNYPSLSKSLLDQAETDHALALKAEEEGASNFIRFAYMKAVSSLRSYLISPLEFMTTIDAWGTRCERSGHFIGAQIYSHVLMMIPSVQGAKRVEILEQFGSASYQLKRAALALMAFHQAIILELHGGRNTHVLACLNYKIGKQQEKIGYKEIAFKSYGLAIDYLKRCNRQTALMKQWADECKEEGCNEGLRQLTGKPLSGNKRGREEKKL